MNTSSTLYRFEENGSFGYKNESGEIVIPAEFEESGCPQEFNQRFLLVSKFEDRKWSDEVGHENPMELKYVIRNDGKTQTCLSDKLKKEDYFTEEIEQIVDGYYQYFSSKYNSVEGYGIIRWDGIIVTEPIFGYDYPIEDFGNKYFKVYFRNDNNEADAEGDFNEGFGIILRAGDYVVKPYYDEIEHCGFYWIGRKDGRHDIMNTYGDILLKGIGQVLNADDEDRLLIPTKNGLAIYSIEKEDFVTPSDLESVCVAFHDQLNSHYMGMKGSELLIFDREGKEIKRWNELVMQYETDDEENYLTIENKFSINKRTGMLSITDISVHQKFVSAGVNELPE